MKRFSSPYSSLHRLRQQESRLAEMELAARVAELNLAQEQQRNLEQALSKASQELVSQGPGVSLAADLLARQRHLSLLEDAITEALRKVAGAQSNVDAAAAEVARRRAEAEVVLKLVEQDRHEHRQEYQKHQQNELDEFGIRRAFQESGPR